MLTAAVRDLHLSCPGQFVTDVRTSSPGLWEYNPFLTTLHEDDPAVEIIRCQYPLIHRSNHLPYHFIHGFRLFLEEQLGVAIQPHGFKGEVRLSPTEKQWPSQVNGQADPTLPLWIVVSGGKNDFTAKWWDPERYQQVVDHFAGRIQFVQCGEGGHHHPPLSGVINLLGQTDLRQMVRLMYHADGALCPVTMHMHLAAAVETRPGHPANRACVVVAGGREPSQWEAYPHHRYLAVNGALPCCDKGGCWKSRVRPLNDGDAKDLDLCLLPVETRPGYFLPRCLDMIRALDAITAIEQYLEWQKWPLPVLHAAPASQTTLASQAALTSVAEPVTGPTRQLRTRKNPASVAKDSEGVR